MATTARGVHHSAICTADVDRALRFWRDGMGLEEIFDLTFPGPWRELFGAARDELRSVFLGDPGRPDTGIVELVVFDGAGDPQPVPPAPAAGFFLLSFEREVEEQLNRLAGLGFADGVRRVSVPGRSGQQVEMAVVHAPDGVLVELIGPPR